MKGWPVAMPTLEEASFIAQTRRRIAEVMEIEVQHTTALSVWNRYAELIQLKELKAQTKKHRRIAASITPSLIAHNTPAGFLFVR